jgi:hypothetical protein
MQHIGSKKASRSVLLIAFVACGTGNGRRPRLRQGESTRAVFSSHSPSLLAQTLREWTVNAECAFVNSRSRYLVDPSSRGQADQGVSEKRLVRRRARAEQVEGCSRALDARDVRGMKASGQVPPSENPCNQAR